MARDVRGGGARLRAVLPAEMVVGIEHFGSTAIPGMAAKPVIDILIAVTSLSRAKQEMVQPVRPLGYVYWKDNPKPDRMFFVKGMPPYGTARTHHVHVCEPEGEMWRRLEQDRFGLKRSCSVGCCAIHACGVPPPAIAL